MKNTRSPFSQFRLLTAAIVLSCVPHLQAQYSDSTLNGPWFERLAVFDTFAVNNLGYMVFDGSGSVTEMSSFNSGCSGFTGNYSVKPPDTLSLNLYGSDCNSLVYTGTILSNTSATYQSGSRQLWKVADPGALGDSLVGTIATPECGQRVVTIHLDSEGVVTKLSGIEGPVMGRVFADSGLFAGHIKTGDTITCSGDLSGWSEFTIAGKFSNDTLKGVVFFNDSGANSGTVLLVRNGTLPVSAARKAAAAKACRFTCRTGPGGAVSITLPGAVKGNLHVQMIDLSGKIIAAKTVQSASGTIAPIFLRGLSKGVYIMSLRSESFTAQERITIE